MASTVQDVLKKHFPKIDKELFDYLTGVLTSDEFESVSDIEDACGEMLAELARAHRDPQLLFENAILRVCHDLYQVVGSDIGGLKPDAVSNGGNRLQQLSAPIHLASMGMDGADGREDAASIWFAQKHTVSSVDQRKLEKAEAKIKAKQERRDGSEVTISGAQGSTLQTNKEATATQALSRKGQSTEANSKSRDIRIENFDISIGDRTLLQNATLTMSFGRRYGLVGRNGIGKSTLLKMLSSRQLCLPAHITVLHVEQEVVGDDTPALESVLECDEERQKLISEERQLTASGVNDSRLSEVYARLHEIDAESAPARACVILAGLGFTQEMQKKPTREFSGGWRMRIALARALFTKPDLLILDEPTNMLDMKAIMWLENYLKVVSFSDL